MGKINQLMVSNETVKGKISEITAPISITHADDFTKSWVILQNIEFFYFNFVTVF